MNEEVAVPERVEEGSDVETSHENIKEPFYKKYKIHLSVAAAVAVVGLGALVQYKNEKVREELLKEITEYQKGVVMIGGEMTYDTLECSGLLTTDCEIKEIKFSVMGQEQLSIGSLRLGNVEALAELKTYGEGGSVDTSIDIEADEVALPQPLVAQLVAQNVSNAFQQRTLEKLSKINFAIEADFEGDANEIKQLEIDRLLIDNAIMPIEFSMGAAGIKNGSPDAMILKNFALTLENRAISDVTYESVKSFTDTLMEEEKAIFLKEFSLTPSQLKEQEQAAKAINAAIAKRFETDLPNASGVMEKDLIRAMIQMLKGEAKRIVLEGENQKDLSISQVQSALVESSKMGDEEGRKYLEDKFKLSVEAE